MLTAHISGSSEPQSYQYPSPILGSCILTHMKLLHWDFYCFDNDGVEQVEAFKAFRTPEVGWDLIVNQNMFIEKVLPTATVRELSPVEMDYYRKPFLDTKDRKPIWRWPNELPIAGEPADMVETVNSYNKKLQESELPKLLFYGSPGALIMSPAVEWCKQNLKNLKTIDVGEGIHYVQEDNPHLIGSELAEWYKNL